MRTTTLDAIQKAHSVISGFVKRTPLVRSKYLSDLCKAEIYLKMENQQHTSSFKIRGALHKMSRLDNEEKERGVVTASSGNHAQAVALASQELGIHATIVVPEQVSKAKLSKIKQYDVEVVLEGGFDEVEAKAREIASTQGKTYVSPYNDITVVAGQGTIGVEVVEELDHFDSIIVPVGGGGLIAGIAVAVKGLRPDVHVIGVQTPGSRTMYESWLKGEVVRVEETETLAEAFLGGVEENSVTLDMILEYVDEIVLVQEDTVEEAIRLLWKQEKQVTEGAAGTSISPLLETPERFEGKTVVAIVSGGNIEKSLFEQIIGKS
jgi:threonine dehydratase